MVEKEAVIFPETGLRARPAKRFGPAGRILERAVGEGAAVGALVAGLSWGEE